MVRTWRTSDAEHGTGVCQDGDQRSIGPDLQDMPPVKLTVEFEWHCIGSMRLDDSGRPVLPRASLEPGLYRFDIERGAHSTVYIGESEQLDRRFQHYRSPGVSQHTNIRLNALLCDTLKAGGAVTVSVVTHGAAVTLDGQTRTANMSQKSERVLLEHAALCAARGSGETSLNL